MFLRNKMVVSSLSIVVLVSLVNNSYGNDNIPLIVKTVKALCKAPSNKKATYYEITGKSKVTLRVKFFALAGGSADFKKKEWNGIQKVLQKDQVKDNNSYRKCAVELSPIFVEKFYKTNSNSGNVKKLKKIVKGKMQSTPPIKIKPSRINAVTHGKNSPIIGTINGNATFNNK